MQNTIKITLALYLTLLSFISFASEAMQDITEQLDLKNASSYQQQYITGGQPSIEDLKKLAQAKVKLIINLRGEGEFSDFDEQTIVEQLGMKYISLPIASGDDLNTINVEKFHQILNSTTSPVFVHCASGNRVGAFFALEAHQFGKKTKDESLAIGKQTGLTRLENQVATLMDNTKEK